MRQYAKKDIYRLRELAKHLREISEDPVQSEHKKLWQDVNDLRMRKPVLHVRDYPLYLIAYENELTTTIEDEFLKSLELDLLFRIYEWNHLRVDRVIEPVIRCQCVIHDTGWGDITRYEGVKGGDIDTSASYESKHLTESIIKTEEDVSLIKDPIVTYDEKATMERFDIMREIFDGILEVKLFGKQYFRVAPWDDIMTWMGMGDGFFNFYDEPELMHATMRRYIDAAISWVKQYEGMGILSSNNAFENVLNNDPGYTTQLPKPPKNGIGAKLKDIWGACSDQILTSVSPEMTKEFAFAYEKEYADLFGLFGYGCCERLDHKMADLKSAIPNLRKVSVSPYTELEPALEQLGNNYVACFKPNSTLLILDDWEEAKRLLTDEMRNVLCLAKKYDTNLVVNMKTLISLNDDPTRLWWWCDMARDVVDAEW